VTSIASFASTDFVMNKFGARPVSQGGAYIARANGPEAIFYNWSKPPEFSDHYFKIDSGQYLETPFYTFSYQNVLNIPQLRLGYINMGIDDIYETELNDSEQPIDTGRRFSNSVHQFYTSFQKEIDNTALGIRVGGFVETLSQSTGRALTFDFGAYRGWEFSTFTYSTGFVFKNINNAHLSWDTGRIDRIPQVLGVGQTVGLLEERLFLSLDVEKESDWDDPKLYTGLEYWLTGSEKTTPAVAIRGGYKNSDMTLGLGMNLAGVMFEYAYVQPSQSFLDVEHVFSIGYSLFPFKPTKYNNEYASTKPYGVPELEYPDAILSPGDADLLLEVHLKLVDDTQTQYWVETNVGKLHINGKTFTREDKIVNRFPMTLRWFPKDGKTLATISLEKYKGDMILSGFLPSGTQLLINDVAVPIKSYDRSVYYEFSLDEVVQVDLLLFKAESRF
jgi:hypothetical protein